VVRDINDKRASKAIGEVKVVAGKGPPPKPGAASAGATEKTGTQPGGVAKGRRKSPPRGHPATPLPDEAWRVDFNDGTLGGGTHPTYVLRGRGKTDPSRLRVRIENGVLLVGADFAEEGALKWGGDYVSLSWPDLGGISLTEYPILEIKYVCPKPPKYHVMRVFPTYEYADGTTQQPYFNMERTGDDWRVADIRLSPDSSLPKKWTPRRLKRLTIWYQVSTSGEHTAKIDYIRLRKFTAHEQALEDQWVAMQKAFTPEVTPSLRDFFPFGVWKDHATGSSKHRMGPWRSMACIGRSPLNAIAVVEADRAHVAAAEKMGLKVCLKAPHAMTAFDKGADDALAWAASLKATAGDSPAVLGYMLKDEPGTHLLWDLSGAAAALAKKDPSRFSFINVYSSKTARAFSPYLPLLATDLYPIRSEQRGGANPVRAFDWCRQIAKENGNIRHWYLVQAFGDVPYMPHNAGYGVPTPAQMRLITYAALAGGAKGILFYNHVFDQYRCMADQWGNPNELFHEAEDLARDLIPVCHRLLGCEVDSDAAATADNDKVAAGILHDPKRGIRYVVVFNKDTTSPVGADLSLPADIVKGGEGVYDLESLAPVTSDGGRFRVAPLKPGGGRIYLVGAAKDFREDKAAILAKQVDETLRTQMTDLHVAELRGGDLSAVKRSRAEAARLSAAGKYAEAMTQARSAAKALTQVLAGLQPYATLSATLDRVAKSMGAVEPAMFEANRKTREAMAPLRDRYWELHRRWAAAYETLLSGDLGELEPKVKDIDAAAQKLLAEIKAALPEGALY